MNDFAIEQFESLRAASDYAELHIYRYGYDAVEIIDGDKVVTVNRQAPRL